mmetsp:Transcript_1676/g.4831  ORF Transcript_1676/g.4831 Transcript_1676/m.4831 type:complete len:1182 (+) Transcript_1676:338-3883(+)
MGGSRALSAASGRSLGEPQRQRRSSWRPPPGFSRFPAPSSTSYPSFFYSCTALATRAPWPRACFGSASSRRAHNTKRHEPSAALRQTVIQPTGLASARSAGCTFQPHHRSFRAYALADEGTETEPASSSCSSKPEEQSSVHSNGFIRASTLRLHYYRKDGRYAGWGLHMWGDTPQSAHWDAPMQPIGFDNYGTFWDVPLSQDASRVWLIVHKGDDTDRGEIEIDIHHVSTGRSTIAQVWLVAGQDGVNTQPPDLGTVPFGDLTRAAAHWLDAGTIAWRVPLEDKETGMSQKFLLHGSSDAGISAENHYVGGTDQTVPLTALEGDLPEHLRQMAPHLHGCTCLRVPELTKGEIAELVKMQLVVSCHTAEGAAVEATGVQIPGVIDQLFVYDGPLGSKVTGNGVSLAVWAPTAQLVELLLWGCPEGGEVEVVAMDLDAAHGVWKASGPASWEWKYYRYRVTAYCPDTQQVEALEATDPYSRSLAADGQRTQIVDPFHPSLMPAGWAAEASPPLGPGGFTDMAIYELHIRDFSASDATVPATLRGKFLAFCEEASMGVKHLRELSDAGITHLHLLPAYDFGTVPEKEGEQSPSPSANSLSKEPSDSQAQQEAVVAVADTDAYNWGYDPVHWSTPEGSYATDPNGPSRLTEFRQMVHAIHGMGLRVVLDVVYNHTFHAGPHDKYSVLDKIVPGYYYRHGEAGNRLHSTCCNNTATEHIMCERLILDDIVYWARAFKVDGFRFDIMGHLLVRTMRRVRQVLDGLTLERDGVDGQAIYLYGEAWDFGEMSCNRRGRNASFLNLHGLGIGSFNDRFRNSVMGGSPPFTDQRLQGIATGLSTDMRMDVEQGSCLDQLERLLEYSDWLRLSLAGGIRSFQMVDRFGKRVKGNQVLFGAVPAAYAMEPWECVNYASCHDNETLFDQVVLKGRRGLPLAERLRMYQLALAFVALGQGVPFFHAGDDTLRSKSLDRDSYNSGDWFNRLDWSMTSNNFGVGLPPGPKNHSQWDIHRPLLADPSLVPSPEHIRSAHKAFLELLAIRKSTSLLHLPSTLAIKNQVKFHNTGLNQIPGVIVMEIVSGDLLELVSCSQEELDDCLQPYICRNFRRVFVVFNCRPNSYSGPWPTDADDLQLHPVQTKSEDQVVASQVAIDRSGRTLEVPARTAAVFVEPREARSPAEAPLSAAVAGKQS